MQLSDHLPVENVAINLAFNSKTELLAKLAGLASRKIGIDKNIVLRALTAREGLGSTGIGQGVAIPHATIEGLKQSLCLFLRLDMPVDFEAVDDVPVDIVVLLLSPPEERGQSLNVLSCIARSLRGDKMVTAVRSADTADEIYALLIQG